MINKGRRSQGIPFVISNTETYRLERVPLTEKLFQENWLQKLIFDNPQILPVDNLEIGFSPLIPLGREISTDVGFIDNLFISSDGYLTIVETKLWRNPEAKREVVGQIIDYAKELTSWSFDKLDNEIKNKHPNKKGIIESINEFENIDNEYNSVLIDNIHRNLKRGRFLLLIVGDGIRESVEDMVDYLSKSAQLLFTLGLVELQIYKRQDNDEMIVVPNLITRTKEITRGIIKIDNQTNANISIETDFSEDKTKSTKSSLSEEEFFDTLLSKTDNKKLKIAKNILNRFREENYEVRWNTASYVIETPDPNGSGILIPILYVKTKGTCCIDYSAKRLETIGLSRKLAYDFCKSTVKLFPNLSVNKNFPDCWSDDVDLKEFEPNLDNFLIKCADFIKTIKEKSF